MTRWLRMTAPCVCLLAVCSMALAQSPERWDRYLDRYRGPYRGQVIDADTKAPPAGAVVVAAWARDRIYPFHSVNERYAVREVLVNLDGQFVIDARDIEEHAPRRTLRPEFTIFLPGYGSFPSFQKAPTGFFGDVFEREGTIVELPRLGTRKERLDSLRAADPYNLSEDPFKEIPRHTESFNQERTALGLEPYPASGRTR
jgi:hypothetical protein